MSNQIVSQRKVTVVGAGNVGAETARRIAEKSLADVVLVDIIEDMPQGKALDMKQSAAVEGFDADVVGANDYASTAGSQVVVITAGKAREPGMSRDDLLKINAKIITKVTQDVVEHSPGAVLITVTNPLDAMVWLTRAVSGFPKERVIGMAGILDTSRFRAFIAMELGVSIDSTFAFVLGSHGDTMVPLPRYSTAGGVPITELLAQDRIDAIVDRTRKGGAEIVNLLKSGSAYYAPSSSIVEMVESILLDRKKILPCCCYLEGEYGQEGIFLGVPAQLGAGGVERIFEIDLDERETEELDRAAGSVRELIQTLEAEGFGAR